MRVVKPKQNYFFNYAEWHSRKYVDKQGVRGWIMIPRRDNDVKKVSGN